VIALGALVAWLTWPGVVSAPAPGLDTSWQAAISVAAQRDLQFGKDVVFTYGPLGFLSVSGLYYRGLSAATFAYTVGLHLALVGVLLASARRVVPLPIAAVAVYALVRTFDVAVENALLPALVLVGCLWGVRRGDPRAAVGAAAVAGVVVGLTALTELRLAIFAAVLLLVAFAALGARDGAAAAAVSAGAAALTFFSLWVAAGQAVANISPYLSRGWDLVAGYSAAMNFEEPARRWEYVAAALVVAVLATVAVAATRSWPPRARVGALALGAAFAFLSLKEGFVRHAGLHSVFFFASAATAVLAYGALGARRTVAAGAAALAFAAYFGSLQTLGWRDFDPVAPARAAVREARLLATGAAERRIERERTAMRTAYGLDASTLADLRGRTTAILPSESGVAWAYPELAWRPVPVFQTYAAYTPSLDELNARFLRSRRAPERILRHLGGILDLRNAAWDPPAATLALVCRYVERRATLRWEVLARVHDRCGPAEAAGSVSFHPGQLVHVPGANSHELVYARLRGLTSSLLYRAQALLFKIRQPDVTTSAGPRYRLVPATAGDPLLMSIPRTAAYSGAFAFARVRAFTVSTSAPAVRASARLSADFYRVPVAPR
jgi:hypothetical protein